MAVQTGAAIELVVVCEELCQSEFGLKVLAELQQREVLRIDVSADVFASITDDRSHGLVGVVRQHEITAQRHPGLMACGSRWMRFNIRRIWARYCGPAMPWGHAG